MASINADGIRVHKLPKISHFCMISAQIIVRPVSIVHPKKETKNVGITIDQKYAQSVLARFYSSLNILNHL